MEARNTDEIKPFDSGLPAIEIHFSDFCCSKKKKCCKKYKRGKGKQCKKCPKRD